MAQNIRSCLGEGDFIIDPGKLDIRYSQAPFFLSNVISFNTSIGLKIPNTKPNNHVFLYAMANVLMVWEYTNDNMKNLFGHLDSIIAIEHDYQGKYLITADKNMIIVWNLKSLRTPQPVMHRVIHKPLNAHDISHVGISNNGKYYLIAGSSNFIFVLQFRNIPEANEPELICDDKFTNPFSYLISIEFSQNKDEENFFCLVFRYELLFGYWDIENNVIVKFWQSKYGKISRRINAACYVLNARIVVSATDKGKILVYSDLHDELSEEPITNNKFYLKSIKEERYCAINAIKSFDSIVITGNSIGHVTFYDSNLKILFTCRRWQLPAIKQISPVLCGKRYTFLENEVLGNIRNIENRSLTELLYKREAPQDYTMEKKPFLCREFYITTNTGDVVHCCAVTGKMRYVFHFFEEELSAIYHHPSSPYIFACNRSPRAYVYKYPTRVRSVEIDLPLQETRIEGGPGPEKQVVCACYITPDGQILAFGHMNGSVLLYSACSMSPLIKEPARYTYGQTVNIIVNSQLRLCAYTDDGYTVVLFQFLNMQSTLIGKFRHHNLPVLSLNIIMYNNMFYLVTVGEDRYYVEYDIKRSIEDEVLVINRYKHFNHSETFTAAKLISSTKVLTINTSHCDVIYLIAADTKKLYIVDPISKDIIYTFRGPDLIDPIRHFICIHEQEGTCNSILSFATDKVLGTILLPIDGNPFRYYCVKVHPEKIKMCRPTHDKRSIIVFGEGDTGGFIWTLLIQNILNFFKTGGEGLTPFYNIIQNGEEGCHLKWMRNLFTYFRLLTSEMYNLHGTLRPNCIRIDDVPDYMRAIGYFPGDSSIDEMKLTIRNVASTRNPPHSDVSFEDIFRLYINHKPMHGYYMEDIILSFYECSDELTLDADKEQYVLKLSVKKLINILVDDGKRVSKEVAKRAIVTLLKCGIPGHVKTNTDHEIRKLPNSFNVDDFCSYVLGLDESVVGTALMRNNKRENDITDSKLNATEHVNKEHIESPKRKFIDCPPEQYNANRF